MDSFRAIVKVETNSKTAHDVRRIFSALGDETRLDPCDTGVHGGSHFFLEDLRALPVHLHSPLIDQYLLANPSAATPPEDTNASPFNTRHWPHADSLGIPALTDLERDTSSSSRPKGHQTNCGEGTKGHPDVNTSLGDSYDGASNSQEAIALGDSNITDGISLRPFHCSSEPVLTPGWEKTKRAVSRNDYDGVHTPKRIILSDRNMQSLPSSAHQERITRLCVSSVGDSPPSATFPISCETRISMNLCGEVITYDLQGLESDARVITELLKITRSERANYLVAAAFYRRSGNPSGAKAVLASMVEEFTAQGVPAEQLKPAFLFLSGCELDLAKFAKAENKVSSVISAHYAAAQTWLQKVFGKAEPPRAQVHVKEGIQPQLRQEDCAASKNRTVATVTTSPSVREIKKMEREIQSLRDRNAHQESQISRLRSTKRKLEDDCAYERNLRRKYQRQLDDMEKDRDAARRMEKFALDQVKRQVSERCKAEE